MTPFEMGQEAYVLGLKWITNPFDAVNQAEEWKAWGDGFCDQEHKYPAHVDSIKIKNKGSKMSIKHVYPRNDISTHDLEHQGQCPCGPRVEFLANGDTLVIHNAWDGRDLIEELEAKRD